MDAMERYWERERAARVMISLGLEPRAAYGLVRGGYKTREEIGITSDVDLLRVRNFGPRLLAITRAWQPCCTTGIDVSDEVGRLVAATLLAWRARRGEEGE
jgi:hypothetical protein